MSLTNREGRKETDGNESLGKKKIKLNSYTIGLHLESTGS